MDRRRPRERTFSPHRSRQCRRLPLIRNRLLAPLPKLTARRRHASENAGRLATRADDAQYHDIADFDDAPHGINKIAL